MRLEGKDASSPFYDTTPRYSGGTPSPQRRLSTTQKPRSKQALSTTDILAFPLALCLYLGRFGVPAVIEASFVTDVARMDRELGYDGHERRKGRAIATGGP